MLRARRLARDEQRPVDDGALAFLTRSVKPEFWWFEVEALDASTKELARRSKIVSPGSAACRTTLRPLSAIERPRTPRMQSSQRR